MDHAATNAIPHRRSIGVTILLAFGNALLLAIITTWTLVERECTVTHDSNCGYGVLMITWLFPSLLFVNLLVYFFERKTMWWKLSLIMMVIEIVALAVFVRF